MATNPGSERDGVIYMFGSSCYEQLIITKGKKILHYSVMGVIL